MSLNEKAKAVKSGKNTVSHVPYRNCLLTMILRDSLGGNCKTRMIANVSAAKDDLLEGISTCRFAKRVAAVANNAVVNEVKDPAVIIEKQQKEISNLKAELEAVQGKSGSIKR